MIKKNGLSKSKWIADLIREKTANVWPDHIRKMAPLYPIPHFIDIPKKLCYFRLSN